MNFKKEQMRVHLDTLKEVFDIDEKIRKIKENSKWKTDSILHLEEKYLTIFNKYLEESEDFKNFIETKWLSKIPVIPESKIKYEWLKTILISFIMKQINSKAKSVIDSSFEITDDSKFSF